MKTENLYSFLEKVQEKKTKLIVDPSKMWRQSGKVMNQANTAGLVDCAKPCAIFFDGRKNAAKVSEDLPEKSTPGTGYVSSQQNHVVLVEEPGSRLVGHVTPAGKLAVDEARAIVGGLADRGVDAGGINALGCDGTPYNTGPGHGVLASIEQEPARALGSCACCT